MYVARCSDGTLYTGITTNIDRRILEHNTKTSGAKYTRSRRPVVLVCFTPFPDRSSASRSEAAFKKLSRQKKLEIINYSIEDWACKIS
jgi:putative endonuclease